MTKSKIVSAVLTAGVLSLVPRLMAQAPAPVTPPPAPAPAAATPATAEDRQKELLKRFEALVKQTPAAATPVPDAPDVVTDPATGKKLERVKKGPTYFKRQNRLFSSVIPDNRGFPIVREDDQYYYIPAPEPAPQPAPSPSAEDPGAASLVPIVSVPESEAEVVEPPVSKKKLRLVEMSSGLPDSGFWRESFVLADLDGDKRLEIVSPPPRLTGQTLRVFKFGGKAWKPVDLKFEDPEDVGFDYGGVEVADMDRDGRNDIVYVQHGRGPAVAFNKGGFRFKIETRGLVLGMSSRSLGLGDLNGDGVPDVVALSDDPESVRVKQDEQKGDLAARLPRADGSVRGFDVRAFYSDGAGRWKERNDGLDAACFGFTMALVAKPVDGGKPFFASSCRYQNGLAVIQEYDTKEKAFRKAPLDFAERFSFHSGTAVGVYKGSPAAFVTYVKVGPSGATREISGQGASVYYREDGTWKRKRIVKFVGTRVESQGIGVGDLDGDGRDDVAFADDSAGRVRIFFQAADGNFEELEPALQPAYTNNSSCVRIADVDGDGRKDLVLMYQPATGAKTRSGGFKFFKNVK